jgi:hypothetical protein
MRQSRGGYPTPGPPHPGLPGGHSTQDWPRSGDVMSEQDGRSRRRQFAVTPLRQRGSCRRAWRCTGTSPQWPHHPRPSSLILECPHPGIGILSDLSRTAEHISPHEAEECRLVSPSSSRILSLMQLHHTCFTIRQDQRSRRTPHPGSLKGSLGVLRPHPGLLRHPPTYPFFLLLLLPSFRFFFNVLFLSR